MLYSQIIYNTLIHIQRHRLIQYIRRMGVQYVLNLTNCPHNVNHRPNIYMPKLQRKSTKVIYIYNYINNTNNIFHINRFNLILPNF